MMKTARFMPHCIDIYVLVGLGWDPETAFLNQEPQLKLVLHRTSSQESQVPRRKPEPPS